MFYLTKKIKSYLDYWIDKWAKYNEEHFCRYKKGNKLIYYTPETLLNELEKF